MDEELIETPARDDRKQAIDNLACLLSRHDSRVTLRFFGPLYEEGRQTIWKGHLPFFRGVPARNLGNSTAIAESLFAVSYRPDHYSEILQLHLSLLCGRTDPNRASSNRHPPKAQTYDRQECDEPYRYDDPYGPIPMVFL